MYAFVQGTLRTGKLPLWNPYILCGQPLLGNPQMGVFYPASLLLPFVPVWLFLSITSTVHLFLAGAFAYCYLRRWTTGQVPALAGAMVYLGSTCLVGRLQFPPMIYTAAYLPLLLSLLDSYLEKRRLLTLTGVSTVIALIGLAAHPQMAYLILLLATVYGVARLIRCQHPWKEAIALAGCLTSALALGGGIGSVQIIPGAQLVLESPREEMTAKEANRFVLYPSRLLTLIAPRFYGHPASGDYWGRGNAWEPAIFVGWIPLLLVAFALRRSWHQPEVRFWSAVCGIGVWLALGNQGGLFTLAFWVVPGVKLFHDPARFLYFTTYAFAVLTALGFHALRERTRWRKPFFSLTVLAGIALPLWWYGFDWNPTTVPSLLTHRPQALTALENAGNAPAKGHSRIYMPEYLTFWRRFVNYTDYGGSDRRTLAAFSDSMLPNVLMHAKVEAVHGYEPVPVQGVLGLDGLVRMAFMQGEPTLSGLAGMMNAPVLFLPSNHKITDPRLRPKRLPAPGLRAWDNQDALPRAWMVRKVRHIFGSERALATVTAPDFKPAQEAIVSGGAEKDLKAMSWCASDEPLSPVALRSFSDTEVRMQANAGASSAFLVYSGAGYPGWKVRVDGAPAPLYRANGGLMGVYLSPGAHDIRLYYAPDMVQIGLYLTVLACGILSSAVTCGLVSRRRILS
jgi:hypothetical protein